MCLTTFKAARTGEIQLDLEGLELGIVTTVKISDDGGKGERGNNLDYYSELDP